MAIPRDQGIQTVDYPSFYIINDSVQEIQVDVSTVNGMPVTVDLDPDWQLLRKFSFLSKEFAPTLPGTGKTTSNDKSDNTVADDNGGPVISGFLLSITSTGMIATFWWKKKR